MRTQSGAQRLSLRPLIRGSQQYRLLLTHSDFSFGRGDLPDQRTFVQTTALRGQAGTGASFAWELRLCADSCWRVQRIMASPSDASVL